MAVGQDHPITIQPFRVGGIVPQEIAPQYRAEICHPHRCAWMAGLGPLYGVHAKDTDGIGQFPAREERGFF